MPATFRYFQILTVNPAGNRITSKHQTRSTTPLSSCSYAAMRLNNPVANHTLISSNTMVLQQYIGLHWCYELLLHATKLKTALSQIVVHCQKSLCLNTGHLTLGKICAKSHAKIWNETCCWDLANIHITSIIS